MMIPQFGGGKLISTDVEVRNGVSYEQKTYKKDDGAVSMIENVVTKAVYLKKIEALNSQKNELVALMEACEE